MMKWKVVKNPRSASADRSLECLRNDVTLTPLQSNNNNSTNTNNNDSNNNVGEESNNNSPPPKESNRHRESSLSRKPSIITTECINLRSILGLTRQRSETNLSCLGLICNETRRSRSEVRGVSCDRLTVGYHSSPGNPTPNGKTRSSSPPSKTGWLRGRKRERESRNPVKNNQEVFGKTVVTGSSRKRTSSKTQNGDGRTIVDGSDNKHKNKLCPSVKSSLEHRKGKGRKSGDEDIIEEEIYAEIDLESVHCKLLEDNSKESFKEPIKVIRKKGLAPKPQIATELFKETNGEAVTLSHNGLKTNGSLNDMHPMPPNRKPPRKNQTFNGRNQDKKSENRGIHSVKLNNLKNTENSLLKVKNNINIQSVVAVAEIHSEVLSTNLDNENTNTVPEPKSPCTDNVPNALPNCDDVNDQKKTEHTGEEESLPFHIDTPDYSTLESANDNSLTLSTEDITLSKEDIINCNTDCDESLQESQNSPDNVKVSRELSLSSILRDSTNETSKMEAETKKTVRFEKLDLIETYKKHKTESCMDTEDDTDISASESQLQLTALDVNSNEIVSQSLTEDMSQSSNSPENGALNESPDESKNLTVNVVVRNPSPVSHEVHSCEEHSPTPFVVKKSFVLTIAKQEKGFRSLCANKKPEPVLAETPTTPTPTDPQISVTFLCSGPASKACAADDRQRLRSTSVPPQGIFPSPELVTAFPSSRGRSRDRKSKDRQHSKKNHKSRKKDAVFVMPQAVIDELSQVLEKRKPSLDEIRQLHP